MHGDFFDQLFRKNQLNKKRLLLEENITDVVLYDHEEIISDFYNEIMEAENEEEVHDTLIHLYNVAYEQGSKEALLAMSKIGLGLITAIQHGESEENM